MRVPLAACLTLAMLAPQAVLGQTWPLRDIVFECPCSAVFTPDADGGSGTLDVNVSIRSFRGSRSMALGLGFFNHQQDGSGWRTHLYWTGGGNDAFLHVSPASVSGGLARLSIAQLPDGERRFHVRPSPLPEGVLVVSLVESAGAQAAASGPQRIDGHWRRQEELALWPVPGVQPDGRIRYVDILTDSDGDGVGDVNEWIAEGWRPGADAPAPDPARDSGSTPSGPSEIDMLWLHPEALEAPDRAAEYRHAGAVAGYMFADSGVDFRLRTASVVAVPDDSIGGDRRYMDPDLLTKLADDHGADVVNVMYDLGATAPLCAAGICGNVLSGQPGLFLPFGAPTAHERVGMVYGHGSDEPVIGWVVAHELGHVLGLAHSAAQGETYGTFRHSRGHYLREDGGWPVGTVMSYGDFSATPVFSSPTSGLCEPFGPCGLSAGHPEGADAVSSLNVMRFQIAAVREAKPDAGGGADGGPALHEWFRSAAVQAAFEEALGKPAADMTEEDLQGIQQLTVDFRGEVAAAPGERRIDLTGLERAANLSSLSVQGQFAGGLVADDLSPLAGLRLGSLWTDHIAVRDFDALSRMPFLGGLSLASAGIDDALLRDLAAAVREHDEMSYLGLEGNLISDASPVCDLPWLRDLRLFQNSIRDASPLECLAEMASLNVGSNEIGAASLLAAVRAMPKLWNIVMDGNPLSLDDFLDGLPDGFLLGTPHAGRAFLGVHSLGISDLSRLGDFLAGLGDRGVDLRLGGNPFHDLGPLVREDVWRNGGSVSLWGARLDDSAFGPDGHVAQLRELGVEVENAPSEPFRDHSFEDGRLGDLVAAETVLWGLVESPITADRLERLVSLHAAGRGISDLSGLEAATRLEYAHLASNRIADLSPLIGLKSLKGADLDGNPLSEAALNEQVPDLMGLVAAASCEEWERRQLACGTVTLNAVSWTPIAGRGGAAVFRTDGYFKARLGVADASEIAFAASADRAVLSPDVSADGLLQVNPVRLAGPATVTVTAEAVGADPVALDFLIVSPKRLPLFLADRGPDARHGFLRVVNHSGRAGDVRIKATDGSGAAFGPVLLPLERHQAIHLNSHDLEHGNPAKGLREGLGDGAGDWRLTLEGRLNAETLAYVRTADGFVTAMHDVAPKADGGHRELLFFNPGSNYRQESVLRLLNNGDEAEIVRITGIDDAGAEGVVTVDLPAGEAVRFTAAELEDGAAPGLSGALGDGTGKWRLRIEAGPVVTAMGLLETPTGHLANLSAPPAPQEGGIVRIPLFLSDSEPSREGFMRVVNRSDRAGRIAIRAVDDAGAVHGPATLSLGPREGRHLNSGDLESGNPAKGLDGSLGAGSGNWRLELDGGGLDFEALAYVRTNDGFVTAMHEAAPAAGGTRRIAFLNPGSNYRQESLLRLANGGEAAADVTVTAIDDAGRAGGAPITLDLPARQSTAITARELEEGSDGLSGSMGDGQGKWRLCVEAGLLVTAMSLLETPTGHLTNLSGSPDLADCPAGGPEG